MNSIELTESISRDQATSNIEGYNPKLQEPPLEMNLNPETDTTGKFENRELLPPIINECLEKVKEMLEAVKTNERLEKYFLQAGTNSGEIGSLLTKLVEDFGIIEEKLIEADVNLGVIAKVMTFLKEILNVNDVKKMSENIDKAIWIVEFESKVMCSMEFIMMSLNIPLDITTKEKECYSEVWKRIKIHELGNGDKIKNGLLFTKKMLSITTSAVINECERDWAISKLVSFGLSYPQYFISNKEGQLRSMIFYRKPTIEMARLIWNIPENGMIMYIAKLGMRSIKTNTKIYIPIDPNTEPTNIFIDDGKSIQVRILYNHHNLHLRTKKKKQRFLFCSKVEDDDEQEGEITKVILHMHGGGFLALSSRSMQTYTRRWARKLNVPVFSVDYRMPPEHKFPTAPNDCFRVYQFLVNSIHKYFNIKPKKIIIAGDSAGGNLSFATTGLIMKEKLPLPHAIFAAYPANDLQKRFSPSKIYSFTDPLLNPTMLLLCLKEYLGGIKEDQINPLASPIFLTEEFIGGEKGDKRFPLKWPKTRIVVGAEDPLYDDSLKTMERMVESEIDCECHVYDKLSHGFLNLDFVIPECEETIKDSIKHLSELFK